MKNNKRIYLPIIFFSGMFISLWSVVLFHTRLAQSISLENILVAKHNLIFPSVMLGIVFSIVCLNWIFKNNKKIVYAISLCIVLVSAFDSLRFTEKFTPFTKSQYLFPTTRALTFLQNQQGLFRIMTTDSRVLPPNFSLMYHLQSIDGYDPLYIKEYGQFIAMSERRKPDIHEPFGFNRIITPHDYTSPFIDLLGVRYILSFDELQSPKLKKVYTEGQTKIYENTSTYPRVFFVNTVVTVTSQQDAANFLFAMQEDLRRSAVVMTNKNLEKNFGAGVTSILSYTPNTIHIKTENSTSGFMVFTDAFYPTWHAYIDGRETKIYPTDLAFRGIVVPKGNHIIDFKDKLF